MTSTTIKRKASSSTSTSTSISTPAVSSSSPLDSIRIATYSDLKREYANLSLCTTNITSPATTNNDDNDGDVKMKETTTTTTTKATRKAKEPKIVHPSIDTKIAFNATDPIAANERLMKHIQQCRVNPVEVEVFNEMKKTLIAPTYFDPECRSESLSREETIQRLKLHKYLLPVLESSYADMLLQEHGKWPATNHNRADQYRLREFPPCIKGVDCVANVEGLKLAHDLEGSGVSPRFIMTQFMLKEEYDDLLSGVEATRRRPIPPRPCVLCCRYQLGQFVPSLRAMRRAKSMNHICKWPEISLDPNSCLQYFREKKDREGGYIGSCMLKPINGVWEGFIDPIVMFNWSSLVVKRHPETNRRYVDQSLLKFRPERPEIPRTADTIANFCSGVDN